MSDKQDEVGEMIGGSQVDLELLGLNEERRGMARRRLEGDDKVMKADIESGKGPNLVGDDDHVEGQGSSQSDRSDEEGNEKGVLDEGTRLRSMSQEHGERPLDLDRGPILEVIKEIGMKETFRRRSFLFLKENVGVLTFLLLGALSFLLLGLLSPDFSSLTWEAWYVVAVLLITLAFLIKDNFPVHVTMLGCILFQLIPGIISPSEALEGFGDSSIATIAVLFITAEGVGPPANISISSGEANQALAGSSTSHYPRSGD